MWESIWAPRLRSTILTARYSGLTVQFVKHKSSSNERWRSKTAGNRDSFTTEFLAQRQAGGTSCRCHSIWNCPDWSGNFFDDVIRNLSHQPRSFNVVKQVSQILAEYRSHIQAQHRQQQTSESKWKEHIRWPALEIERAPTGFLGRRSLCPRLLALRFS